MSELKKKLKAQRGALAVLEENRPYLILFGVIVAALLVILVSILSLHLPVVSVCLILLIEAGMAVCLQQVPIWLHGIVVIAEVVLGIITGKWIFMLMCVAINVVGILALKFMRN